MRKDIIEQKQQILYWISEKQSKSYIAKMLKCKIDTLNEYLKKMNIQYSGNMSGKGHPKQNQYINALEYLKTENPKASITRIKLIKEGIKLHKCEICDNSEWMGKPIPLELDHIDGNRYNYDFNNLRIICPNCHAQTDTNSGKNIRRYDRINKKVIS